MGSRDLNVELIKKKSHAHYSCFVHDGDTALQETPEFFMKLKATHYLTKETGKKELWG